MRRARFLKPDLEGGANPERAIYHVVSRVVDRRFVLKDTEKEYFRRLMRMYERFSGCRVLSYCFMTNHFHLLLEVPPGGVDKGDSLGLSDEELIYRLGGLYSDAYVQEIQAEIEQARELISGSYAGVERLSDIEVKKNAELGRRKHFEIHSRYSYRMISLSEFMKGFLQRFTRWFNREQGRRGTLWEERFKSTIIESGMACRATAAYIDLNPVRAGIVKDPADYRWSSYGEAVAASEGSRKAQEGLASALTPRVNGSVRGLWKERFSKEYRRVLISAAVEKGEIQSHTGVAQRVVVKKGMSRNQSEEELVRLSDEAALDLKISKSIQIKVRYFTDGAVLGSKRFVNGIFSRSRHRFSAGRQDGARKPRGALKEMSGELWSMRDLQRE